MVIRKPFRFLRRLEQALKERDKVQSDSGPDDSDVMDSPKASSPLLASSAGKSKSKSTHFSFSKQRRVANVYNFDPEK